MQINTDVLSDEELKLPAKHLFRGPFAYSESTDGVDSTFDVYCASTHRIIASTRYRETRQDAEIRARFIVEALNHRFRYERRSWFRKLTLPLCGS